MNTTVTITEPTTQTAVAKKIHIRKWGNGPRTALLIHGLAASGLTWKTLAKQLAESGYTVYAPDLPGHGRSERETEYSVSKWADIIAEHYPQIDLLVGHSIGALIATQLQHKLNPTHTVLVDPVLRLPGRGLRRTTQTMFKFIQYSYGYLHKKHSPVRTQTTQWDTRTVKALLIPDTMTVLSKPTLVLRSKFSYIAPTRMRTFITTIKTVTIPKAGHNIHKDNYPAMWAAIKEFLTLPAAITEPLETLLPGKLAVH